MWTELGRFMLAIIPPSHGSPQRVLSWRYRMAMCQIASSVSSIMSWIVLLAAFGVVGSIGFASDEGVQKVKEEITDDVQKVKDAVKQIQIGQLEARLFDTRLRQCHAMAERNSAAKTFLGQQLSSLQHEYRDLTGHDYLLPACREL